MKNIFRALGYTVLVMITILAIGVTVTGRTDSTRILSENELKSFGLSTPMALGASATTELKEKAEQGDSPSQFALGTMYDTGRGVVADKTEAIRWYRLAAERGNVSAQQRLGMIYWNGEGTPVDIREAIRWLGSAAEQGNAIARLRLGAIYFYGTGVAKDDVKALVLIRMAAEQQLPLAQWFLGTIYEEGAPGVPIDLSESERLFRMAAVQGCSAAQYYLGNLYYSGKAKGQRTEAEHWYRMAAEQGEAGAQFMLGRFNLEISHDSVEAAKWFRTAAGHGHKEASDAYSKLSYTSYAGAGSSTLAIETSPPEVRFVAYSSSGVLYEGMTPFHRDHLPDNLRSLCFERKGYEPFYKAGNLFRAVTATLRPLPPGSQAQPRCTFQYFKSESEEDMENAQAAREKAEDLDRRRYERLSEGSRSPSKRSGPFIHIGGPNFIDTSTGKVWECPGAIGKPTVDIERDCTPQ